MGQEGEVPRGCSRRTTHIHLAPQGNQKEDSGSLPNERNGSREGEDDPARADGFEDRAEDRHPGHGENDDSNRHAHNREDRNFQEVGEGGAPSRTPFACCRTPCRLRVNIPSTRTPMTAPPSGTRLPGNPPWTRTSSNFRPPDAK
ncbi:hypothetical protein Trydic_g7679 [Trypoxylus dichotomus]